MLAGLGLTVHLSGTFTTKSMVMVPSWVLNMENKPINQPIFLNLCKILISY